MHVKLVAAVSANGIIGKGNDLVIKSKTDMMLFKHLTMGNPVIMGNKTYHSLPGPLKGRIGIVLSRSPSREERDVFYCTSFKEALSLTEQGGYKEVCIIGGGDIYRAAIMDDIVDTMYITEFKDEAVGDIKFPYFDKTQWSSKVYHEELSEPQFTMVKYTRVRTDTTEG